MSYLYYADRIYQINLAIAGIAIGTVLLPTLSKHIKTKNKKKSILFKINQLSFVFLSLPAMFALLIASEEITSSLFGYGSFDIISVEKFCNCIILFCLWSSSVRINKNIFHFFYLQDTNTKIPFYFSLVSVLINILISVIFFNKIGFIIIPIATTISSWINTLILFIYICKKIIIKLI